MIAGLGSLIIGGLAASAAGTAGDIAIREAWRRYAGDEPEKRRRELPAVFTSWWQASLSAVGFPVEMTGRFDAATEKATKAFQLEHALRDDGIAGPRTIGRMAEVLKKGSEDGK